MKKLRPIFLASFFFSLHLALTAYVNSSMLGTFLTPKGTGIIFTLSSVLSLFLVGRAAKLIERFGAVRCVAVVLAASAALLFLIGATSSSFLAVLLFIPYFALGTIVFYCFDLFLEHFAPQKHTGNARGAFLALKNAAWVGMPAFSGFLQSNYGYGIVYVFAGFAVVCALMTVLVGERGYQDPKYVHVSFSRMLRAFMQKSDVRGAIVAYFMLQLFFVWMVIYTPLYLTRTLGYSWESVGIVLSIMLVPFLLLQYPAGRLADRYANERELIAGGFLIMGVATMVFSLIDGVSLAAIALILFLTRVGASIVEVSVESYFFKLVHEEDTGTIAIFRNMFPFAYVIGPMLAIILLGWSMYAVLFFILGALMLAASFFSLTLHESRKE